MKKLILSAAIIISGLTGFTTFAQTPECTNAQCEQTECSATADKCSDSKECKGRRHDKKRKHHRGSRPDFFEGIDLTPEQQSALSNLRPTRRHNDSGQRDDSKCDDFKSKVKNILTPEQYAQFEQNWTTIRQQKSGNNHRAAKNKPADRSRCTNGAQADRK